MLKSYTSLKAALDAKNRGRKHEAKINDAPELWAGINDWSHEIVVNYASGGHVCTLMPDNSMRIMFGDWHTPTTCRIIQELSGRNAWLRDNHTWFGGLPTVGGVLYFDTGRNYIPPKKFFDLSGYVYTRLQTVTKDSLSPKIKLLLEMGELNNAPRITQRVKDFALGKIELDALTPKEVITCMTRSNEIVQRVLEEAV